jgi:hypothetical protein
VQRGLFDSLLPGETRPATRDAVFLDAAAREAARGVGLLEPAVSWCATAGFRIVMLEKSIFPKDFQVEFTPSPFTGITSHLESLPFYSELNVFPFQELTRLHLFNSRLVLRQKATDARSVESLYNHTQVGPNQRSTTRIITVSNSGLVLTDHFS